MTFHHWKGKFSHPPYWQAILQTKVDVGRIAGVYCVCKQKRITVDENFLRSLLVALAAAAPLAPGIAVCPRKVFKNAALLSLEVPPAVVLPVLPTTSSGPCLPAIQLAENS